MKNAKSACIIVMVGLILMGGVVGYAMMMQGAQTRYFCATSGNWNDNSNWFDVCDGNVIGKPGPDDPAVIVTGKTCNVDITGAECEDLTVESGATLNVQSGKKLTLRPNSGTQTSTITGTVYLQGAASELFGDQNSHTIGGNGAIVGQNDTAVIRVAANKTLTLSSTTTVRGHLKILTNSDAMFLNLGTVQADVNGGVLKVEGNAEDAASAYWKVTAAGATLEWADYDTSIAGNFWVSAGELRITNQLSTTGTLTMTGGKTRTVSWGADFNY